MKAMLKFFSLFISILSFNTVEFAQLPLKAFPQHVAYFKNTIKPSHVSQQLMDDSVRSFYRNWKQLYIQHTGTVEQCYVNSKGSAGKNTCVSEGQGYGMIITVLMAGEDTGSHHIYDGLFRYYKSHPSSNSPYLMAWAQTDSFKSTDGSSASDGDLDIAYSLLLAGNQWGNEGNIDYHKEAKAMLSDIMQQEINPLSFSVLLSNSIEPDSKDYFDMRSSDFMPAHFKTFSSFMQDKRWDSVVDKNYQIFTLLQNRYSKEAGLLPDFIQHVNEKPIPAKAYYLESKFDGNYNYNACRVPWRIATDFIISGDIRSKMIVEKINQWIRGTTQNVPDNISAGYTLGGDDMKSRNFEAMGFISSFAVAAMVDTENQTWLNRLWDYIMSFNADQYDYYDNTIKMFTMIILSGNYWVPFHK